MLINIVQPDGAQILNTTAELALAAGVDQSLIDTAVADAVGRERRKEVRGKINATAGDTLSLLGTTSDASTIAVLVGACFMASLDETTSYGAFRAKATAYMDAISGEHDPTQIAQAFLASLAAGEVRLPALEKGIVEVLAEVTERGNAVAEAINPQAAQD